MAEATVAATPIQSSARATIQPMQVAIKGRIELMRSYDGKRFTQIMTPAADAYSRPQIVEVRSKAKLGDRGDEVSIIAQLGGYQRKAYQAKDKDSGEIVTIVPVEHVFDVIEDR